MGTLKRITDDYDALLFDMDGTLVDSMWIWHEIDIQYLGRFGLEVPPHLQQDIEGMGFTETAEYFKERFSLHDPVETIMHDWNEMAADFYTHTVQAKPGVQDFLQEMKRQGRRMAVATSNSRQLAVSCIDRLALADCIECVITACDVSGGKPLPDIYLAAAKALDTPPSRCLVFEDVPMGILAGRRAGMKVCAVEDDYSMPRRDKVREMADWYIRDYHQILDGTQENLGDHPMADVAAWNGRKEKP